MTGIGFEIMNHPQRDIIVTFIIIVAIFLISIEASEKLQNFFLNLFEKIKNTLFNKNK